MPNMQNGPAVHIDIQIHMSPESTADEIDKIFDGRQVGIRLKRACRLPGALSVFRRREILAARQKHRRLHQMFEAIPASFKTAFRFSNTALIY